MVKAVCVGWCASVRTASLMLTMIQSITVSIFAGYSLEIGKR